MTAVHLTRQQQRQMRQLADKVDRVSQADRLYFERFPHRQHRLRLASAAEIEQHTILDGKPWMPPGCRLYVIVKHIAPGVRLRAFLRAPVDSETDVSEETASEIFEAAATPRTREIEASLRKTAEAQR